MKKLLLIGLIVLVACLPTGMGCAQANKTGEGKNETIEAKPALTQEEKIVLLIKQLGDEDWQKREEATQKLIEIGRPATKYLKKALKNQDAEIKLRAKLILSEIGDLVAYWKFDENEGTVVKDSSGKENHGQIYGAKWVTGTVGSALSFDGTDDYIDVGNSSNLKITGPLTLEAWFKTNSSGKYMKTISSYDYYSSPSNGKKGYLLYMTDAGSVQFDVYKYLSPDAYDAAITTNKFNDGLWHHAAGVFLANGVDRVQIYVDGVLQSVTRHGSAKPNLTASTVNLNIGRGGPSNHTKPVHYSYFNGLIDEVKIYSYARSAAEIKADYSKTK